ncbi:hypothetical protein QFC20_003721 [Naganishia adeliensis]|uniref:Uncharacterized protein n=1 Tax=Naganishia adeliensis TaxID=92952 RepID=A0ACC2W9P0_9TREE|nr:hypothetical protein QFC20_003721 [Naganishia adeliensis]
MWARASSPEIPRIQTTMIVESLWGKIKRRYLFDFNRPRLHLALYLSITNIVPGVRETILQLQGLWRHSRADALFDWQEVFKKEWKTLSKSENDIIQEQIARRAKLTRKDIEVKWTKAITPTSWNPSVASWTCFCPALLFSRFLMCNHLVREVNSTLRNNHPPKDREFFTSLRRYHAPPFYRLQGIHEPLPDVNSLSFILSSTTVPSRHLLASSSASGLRPNPAHLPSSSNQNALATMDDLMGLTSSSHHNTPNPSSEPSLAIDSALLRPNNPANATHTEGDDFMLDLEKDDPRLYLST